MKTKLMVVAYLLAVSSMAWAQMTPQLQQQLPPSNPSSSQYHSVYLPAHGVGDTIQPSERERWEDRWGAIATDAESAKLGVATDMSSKSAARQEAIAQCKREGGVDCRLDIAYYNQCAVLVTGDRVYNTSSAATADEAARVGLDKCDREDSNCRVYYSGCSLPVRVQ